MTRDEKRLAEKVLEACERPLTVRAIARALAVRRADLPRLRDLVAALAAAGDLAPEKGRRWVRASGGGAGETIEGTLAVTRGGTGFVAREGGDDIRVHPSDLLGAVDGDRVVVRVTVRRAGRLSGKVVRVVERARMRIVGVFERGGGRPRVRPDNPRIPRSIDIPPGETAGARDGEKVVVLVGTWGDSRENPSGKIEEVLGLPTDPGVDMLSIVRSFSLPEKFPSDVIEEAERAAARDAGDEEARRVDRTGDLVYTIDPIDAKDHDDAVSVERTKGGFRLGVHIADVAFYVDEKSALDREAFRRGNSVYLPGLVIPMLPEVLSNDVCSLRPNRRRLAHSVFIEFDAEGKPLSHRFEDTVIRSRAKLAYEEVQRFFDEGAADEKIERVGRGLETARELAHILCRRRTAEGSLDFDLPEAKIVLNEKGEVIELGRRVRLEAHRLIEEFMLAANRAVAEEVTRRGQPFLYRVHGKPDKESLTFFSYMVGRLGYPFPVSDDVRPIRFARFLEKVKGKPEADLIHELMLRSMQKAVYQRENIGHFGLAFRHYTHFTSPIRRYPDLLVHRMLRKIRERGAFLPSYAQRIVRTIDAAGKHCSETERAAEAAERQAVRIKQVQYMAKHVGEEFDGFITGVTAFGFFVRLGELGAEGLVRASSLDDDFYKHEERNARLVGRRTGRAFRMGDSVRVGVARVDPALGEIDLYLPEKPKAARRGGRMRKRR
ncbi:MAG: ribonuclease R [Candidatus Latescibacterota bacterium]|nr:MAG: ribonuclease R [Candidatus Latescibacterota bacterium]